MKKIGVLFLVAAFTIGAANVALADADTTAKKLTISGGMDIKAVYQDALFDNWRNNPFSEDRTSDAFVNVDYALDFDFAFDQNVSFHLGLANESGDDFAGNMATVTDFGGRETILGVKEGYILVEDFLVENLDFKTGIMNLAWDPIGKGSMFLNIHANMNSMQNVGAWCGTYTSGDFAITGIISTIAEMRLTGGSAAATPSRPNARDTIELQGIVGSYSFGEKGNLGFLIAHVLADNTAFTVQRKHGDPADPSSIAATAWNNNVKLDFYNIGIAAKYNVWEMLNVYGEVDMQFGDAGVNTPKSWGVYPGAAEAGGMALMLGVDGKFADLEYKPWFDLSYVSFSGDEDADLRGVDDDEGFISLSNGFERLLVLEDRFFGINVAANYWALALFGGIEIPNEPWSLSGALAMAEVDSTDKFMNLSRKAQTSVAAGGLRKSASSDLGIEIDLCAKYTYSEDLFFRFGLGYLTGCAFNEEVNTNQKKFDPVNGATINNVADGEDTGMLFVFEVNLDF